MLLIFYIYFDLFIKLSSMSHVPGEGGGTLFLGESTFGDVGNNSVFLGETPFTMEVSRTFQQETDRNKNDK